MFLLVPAYPSCPGQTAGKWLLLLLQLLNEGSLQPAKPGSPGHTTTFNGLLSGTTRVSRYQKGKTNLDFTEARDSEWQWHQLGHMQVCTSLKTDNHASTLPLSFLTGQMLFLPPNQQRQSTEGNRFTRFPWTITSKPIDIVSRC